MVADIAVDDEAVTEPAPREEELNVRILKGGSTRTNVRPQLDILGEVAEYVGELLGECGGR